jgi:hypothetical protein
MNSQSGPDSRRTRTGAAELAVAQQKGVSPAADVCVGPLVERDVGNSSSVGRERGEHQQRGPLDVQVLVLFGSGLAPAPGRVRIKKASPVMAESAHRAGVGCVVAAEPGVRDKAHALLPKRPGLRGSPQPLLHPPFTVRRRPHSAPLRACRRRKHSQLPLQPHALPADTFAVAGRSARHYRHQIGMRATPQFTTRLVPGCWGGYEGGQPHT